MDSAILNSELIATKMGNIIVHNHDSKTWEYISTSNEYPAISVDIPACSCLDVPGTHKMGYAIYRSVDLNSWEYVPGHRGEIVYSTRIGESKEIIAPSDYPENTATIVPLTSHNEWNGEKWVIGTEAQHGITIDAAEAQRQPLIDVVTASIDLIQLKL